MSLISFSVYQEMARPPYARLRRGKSTGSDAADVSRIPPNIEEEDIDFLKQFEFKDYGRAMNARQNYFVEEILPKLQKAIDSKIKESGLENSVFLYLKSGRHQKELTPEVIEYIKNNFHIAKEGGLDIPVGAPAQTSQLIKGIKEILKDFDSIGKSHLIDADRRKSLTDLIDKAEEAERSGSGAFALRHELSRAYKSLKRDDKIEDISSSILYELFKKQTTEDEKFWKDNGLDPDKIKLDFTDGRSKSARSGQRRIVEATPHFFRLYHKLERTRGAEHVADLVKILGPKGGYGYDMSYPFNTGGVTSTTGTEFGSDWASFVKDWIQHYSYGHFGKHSLTELDPDNVVWLPVSLGSSEVKDPLYDWMVEKLAKEIEKDKESGVDDSDPECQKPLKDGKGYKFIGKAGCALIKAEKMVKKMIVDGKLYAPPVPCNNNFQEKCPSKEDRMYKLDSSGKVLAPPVYLPHQRTSDGKYVPLLKPSRYVRQLDAEADKESYNDILKKAQEEWGDHLSPEYTYKDGEEERTIRFPVWGRHSIDDDETLNMGASTFKGFGPNWNKNTPTRNHISPVSVIGKRIIDTYLIRDPKTGMVEDFKAGILSCLGGGAKTGSGCGGAPGFILDAMKQALADIHEIIYSEAMDDLLAMEPKDPEADSFEVEPGKFISMSRTKWALGKTSNIAGSAGLYNLGYENYSRRLGVQNRVLNAPEGGEGRGSGDVQFSDKGFDTGDAPAKRRGKPTGAGLNKDLRNQAIRDVFLQSPEAKRALEVAAAKAKAEVGSIQTNKEDPYASLEQKVVQAGRSRADFEVELRRVLKGLGKSDEEAQNIINQFKDESIDSIMNILRRSLATQAKVKPTPVVRQVKAAIPATAGTQPSPLLARLKQKRSSQDQPPLEKDPKVDWVKFNGLSINERISYLKGKLRSPNS